MRIELRIEARHDLAAGANFYDQQRAGLGDYFLDCLFEDLDRLGQEAGIHARSTVSTASFRRSFRSYRTIEEQNP